MTQETPQKVSDMVRTTVGNASEFFNKLADHIDHLENTISQLQEKITQYENSITPELVIEIIKQNQELQKQNNELQKQMLEVIKNGTTNNSTNIVGNTTNSHNKAFNLQFFLNETCKDAMNIGEFVDSLKLQLSDLEKVGEAGYIEGISSIIVKNLKELDITKRPVHCTDKKRETIYIKDDNKWEKEDDNKTKLRKAIKKISSKTRIGVSSLAAFTIQSLMLLR